MKLAARSLIFLGLLVSAACTNSNVNVFKEGALPRDFSGSPVIVKLIVPDHQRAASEAAMEILLAELREAGVRVVDHQSAHRYQISVEQRQAEPSDRVKTTADATPLTVPIPNIPTVILLSRRSYLTRIQKTTIRLSVSPSGTGGETAEMYYRVAVYEGSCGSLPDVIPPLYAALFDGFPDNAGRTTIWLDDDC